MLRHAVPHLQVAACACPCRAACRTEAALPGLGARRLSLPGRPLLSGRQHTQQCLYRVRDFQVIDASPFGFAFTWDKDGTPTTSTLFERGSSFPNSKVLTLNRRALLLACFSRCPHKARCLPIQLQPVQL